MNHVFRCKNCGHLHPASHAGERPLPAACVVCKAGVKFLPDGSKEYDRDVWEVLAKCTPERLKELGLGREDVVEHVHNSVSVAAVHAANAAESAKQLAVLDAKKARWDTNKDKIQADIYKLEGEQASLQAKVVDPGDTKAFGEHATAKITNRQRVDDLFNQEFTAADAKLRAEHEDCVKREGKPSGRAPTTLKRGALDQGLTTDRTGAK